MRRLTRKPWRRSIFSIDLWVGFLKLLGLSGSLSLWGLLGLSAALLWCPRALAADADDFDFTYDIPSMIQLNPDFSTYPGSDGVIWLKRIDYRIAPEGGIERKSLWILLGRKGLDPRWLLWNVPVPRSGHAEILEASAYSPGSGEKIMDALEIASTGDTMRVAAFSNLPDEFILVVSYRELFPEKLSVEDLVWVAEPLPVWETALRVTVPAGHPFYYGSNADAVPKASNVDDRMVYEWRVINTEAFRFSLRGDSRGYIAFGSREGREAAVRSVKELEAARLPEPPSVVGKVRESGKRAEARAVENVLKWIYEQPELLSDGPREIPAEAPWTLREKLLLAYGWLKAAGVDVRLFWQLAYRPAADEPACAAMAVAPVLGVPGIEKKEAF
ncbi:MAG: hypothetical protein LBQ90_08740, partial [Synergistaceae bacterium]|nr:hypothetical protein [Synergistaceae bacterium]